MNIQQLYKIYTQHPSVQTDTRKLQPGDIFFALRGPNFNANEFAHAAIEEGAAYAVVDQMPDRPHPNIIVVDNVLNSLQSLAKHHRQQFKIPFIAITGSNGKTTTKELVHTVLSSKFKTYTTQGNLNNHIGIPLTILQVRPDAQMAVIEMGANHQREIASYCEYTLPTHGIITNCGKAHLEGFGGEEGVRKGKGELYDYLRANDGTAFVMWDYDYLHSMSRGIEKIFKYGTSDADVTGIATQSEPFLAVEINTPTSLHIQTKLVGEYNLPNVLVAVAVGKYFGVPDDMIRSSIEKYTPSNSRSQLVEKNGNKIILDAYNANPSSMRLAIENLAKLPAENKVLMLGGMAELGEGSLKEHEQIVHLINQYKWKDVVLVGGDFLKIDHPFHQLKNSAEAAAWYRQQQLHDSYILIKGSRSMQMERVLE